MTAGSLLLAAGLPVTPGRVAVLASAGCDPVAVFPRPRVALIPTGDELRPPSDFRDVLAGTAIPESNGPALAAACRAVGVAPRLFPPVPDDRAALRSALEQAASDSDVVVTMGGASMGTADLVKDVLVEMGYRLDFWRVKMRPGSPVSLGYLPRDAGGPLPVLGLPGNPASSFVTFQLLVRPLLLRLAGEAEIHRPVVDAMAGSAFASHPSRTLFPRVVLELDDAGGLVVLPAGPQGSGLVRSLGEAHGLAVIPAGPPCPAGTPLRVLLLDDQSAGSEEPGYLDRLQEPGAP
jgi:molybdopterin molybdotransferase